MKIVKFTLGLVWGVCIMPFGLLLMVLPITWPAGLFLIWLAAYPLKRLFWEQAVAPYRGRALVENEDDLPPWELDDEDEGE